MGAPGRANRLLDEAIFLLCDPLRTPKYDKLIAVSLGASIATLSLLLLGMRKYLVAE